MCYLCASNQQLWVLEYYKILLFKGGLDIGPTIQTSAPINNTLPLMNSQNNILNSLNTAPNYLIDGLGDTNSNQAAPTGM